MCKPPSISTYIEMEKNEDTPENININNVLGDFFSRLSECIYNEEVNSDQLNIARRMFFAYLLDNTIKEGIIYDSKEYEEFLLTGWFMHMMSKCH